MLEALGLSLVYLGCFAAMGTLAILCGYALLPSRPDDDPLDFPLDFVLRYGLGLALLSCVIAWLGLFGLIRSWAVLLIAVIGAVAGATQWQRGGGRRMLCAHLYSIATRCADFWRRLHPAEKISAAAVGVWITALCANILVGGFAPDMSHDSMWYHLSVPGQWAVTGRAAAFPYVFPSNYPLALEAIFAGLLLFGNETLCGVLSAQITLALLAAIIIAAGRWAGGRGALAAAAVLATGVAVFMGIAPLGVKNDRYASLMLCLGFVALMEMLARRRNGLELCRTLAVGFLLGTSFAAKTLAIAYCLPMAAIAIGAAALEDRKIRRALTMAALLAAGAGIAYLPWLIRGLLYGGDPFFPFGAHVFGVREPYAAAVAAVQSVNMMYPLTRAGLCEALSQGLPQKILFSLTSSDYLLSLYLAAAIVALFSRLPTLRSQGLILLSFGIALVAIKGHNEVVRYFAVVYPLSAPVMACMFVAILGRLGPKVKSLFLGVVLIACALTYTDKQIRFARFETVQWRFHPVVSERQRQAYATHAEKGNYSAFRALQPAIEPDAGVLMPDYCYPFYLGRRCLWADEVVQTLPGQVLPWRRKSSEVEPLMQCIRDNNLRYILLMQRQKDDPLETMIHAGFLAPVSLPPGAPAQWSLWKIARNIEPK